MQDRSRLKFPVGVADALPVRTLSGLDTLTLVSPLRLGQLLVEHRCNHYLNLEALARRTAGRFSVAALVAIEAGGDPLSDEDLGLLSDAYGVYAEPFVRPHRTRLVMDTDDAMLADPAPQAHRIGLDTDEALVRYVGLIHVLRAAVVANPLPLRHEDLEVLASALYLEPAEVQQRLDWLMLNARHRIGRRMQRLRRRMVIPAAGILVGTSEAGQLILEPHALPPGSGVRLRAGQGDTNVIALAQRESTYVATYAAHSA